MENDVEVIPKDQVSGLHSQLHAERDHRLASTKINIKRTKLKENPITETPIDACRRGIRDQRRMRVGKEAYTHLK